MPPPASRYQKPTVKKPVLQSQKDSVTSTDTWNKPTSTLDISGPSTKSTVPGVEVKKPNNGIQKPAPPRRTSGGSTSSYGATTRKPVTKPLPGGKLRPLQINNREDNSSTQNTWDPKNRPLILNKPVVAVKATKARLNGAGEGKGRPSQDSPTSRSSSVASVKPVLPGIKKTSDDIQPVVETEGKHVQLRETKTEGSVQLARSSVIRQKSMLMDGPAQGARRRETTTIKLLEDAADETELTDQYTDYFIPEWYRNPLIKPGVLKGGITVFSIYEREAEFESLDINYITISSLRYIKDLKKFMADHLNRCLLTMTYFESEEEGLETLMKQDLPATLSKELALEANSTTSKAYYKESVHDPEVYHLMQPYEDPADGDVDSLHNKIDVVKYYSEVALSLGIKSVSKMEELDAAIVKAQKRRINLDKQEKANHPHVYLQPFESADVWNHINTCHTFSENCFERKEQLEQVKAAIKADTGVESSPLIISGALKTGKTYLCSQIPKVMGEDAVTVVRFCGLTQLSHTLPKLLRGITKQLHLIFGSLILPRSVELSIIDDLVELFKSVLLEVSQSTTKPLVLVLDSFDKVAVSNDDVIKFIMLCQNSIPINICFILSITTMVEKSEFYDQSMMSDTSKKIEEYNKLLGPHFNDLILEATGAEQTSISEMLNEELDGVDLELVEKAGKVITEAEERRSEDNSLDENLAIQKVIYEKTMELVDHIKGVDVEKRTNKEAFENFEESIAKAKHGRSILLKVYETHLHKLNELYPDDADYISSVGQHLTSLIPVNGLTHIQLTDFTTEQGKQYIQYLSQGRLEDSEVDVLKEIAEYVHNPLLLRLIFNRCYLRLPAATLVSIYKKVLLEEEIAQEFYKKATEREDGKVQGLPHLLTSPIIFSSTSVHCAVTKDDEAFQYDDEIVMSGGTHFSDMSMFRPTDADRLKLGSIEWEENDNSSRISIMSALNYLNEVMEGCQLEVYEQGDYVRDVEQVETLLRSNLMVPKHWKTPTPFNTLGDGMELSLDRMLKQICKTFISLAMYGPIPSSVEEILEGSDKTMKDISQQLISTRTDTAGETFQELIAQYLRSLINNQSQTKHEVDSWNETKELPKLEGGKLDLNAQMVPAGTQDPVTSGKDKNYPQGRRKVLVISLIERLIATYSYEMHHLDDDTSQSPLYRTIEMILQFDFLMPLLQEFGADYVVEHYGNIIELLSHNVELSKKKPQNMFALEMLYNLLVVYILQLRENPTNFYTLFLSMCNEDSTLTSRAAFRLYKRVMHEVDIRNNLHVVTMLSKSADSPLLSKDAKKYLQNASRKYQASQCISNFYYILSHNKNNLVKLWELTGEFISAQKFDGRIVCVCAQRENRCFLAVVETVSEVGQKFASVWRIDRLKHKKLADIGSKSIISAWFDKKGEKLIVVEQHTADEIKVVVSTPQTMEIKLEEGVISIVPYKESSFMNKCLVIPHKVDEALIEIMSKHLSGDKKDADPSELHFFKKVESGGCELDPAVATNPLVFESLECLWDDMLDKFDAKEELVYPMKDVYSAILPLKEHVNKMKIHLHGMTSAGDIVVDCQYSDGSHDVLFYKAQTDSITLKSQLAMNEQATMTLMPTDDFVYSDTGSNSGLISWNLPTDVKKIFGNELKVHVTCLQFEVEEGQILSFTRGQVTVWNAVLKTTESSFTLDKGTDIVAACLQDNWLAIANRDGELSIRFEIRKKIATYQFHEPIDWIDCHVIGDYLYIACHLNGKNPSICFLKYRVSDAPIHEREKYVARDSTVTN